MSSKEARMRGGKEGGVDDLLGIYEFRSGRTGENVPNRGLVQN